MSDTDVWWGGGGLRVVAAREVCDLMWGLGFRFKDLRFRVWCLVLRVEGLGFRTQGFRVWGLESGVWNLGLGG